MTDTDLQQRNGLDVAAVRHTADHVLHAGEPLTAVVETRHHWAGGHAVAGQCRRVEALGASLDRGHHHVRTDLPALLGGSDTAPAPTEALLTALAGCITATFVEAATLEGIELAEVEVSTRASLDLRGAYGVEGVPASLAGIDVELAVRTAAPSDAIEALGASAAAASPTAASLTNPVPVRLTVRHVG